MVLLLKCNCKKLYIFAANDHWDQVTVNIWNKKEHRGVWGGLKQVCITGPGCDPNKGIRTGETCQFDYCSNKHWMNYWNTLCLKRRRRQDWRRRPRSEKSKGDRSCREYRGCKELEDFMPVLLLLQLLDVTEQPKHYFSFSASFSSDKRRSTHQRDILIQLTHCQMLTMLIISAELWW